MQSFWVVLHLFLPKLILKSICAMSKIRGFLTLGPLVFVYNNFLKPQISICISEKVEWIIIITK